MDNSNGVAVASGKPYFSITQQRRYRALVLNYAATTLALTSMTFTIKINGIIFQTFTGDFQNVLNQIDGLPAAAANTGQLIIPFSRWHIKDWRWGDATAINLGVKYPGVPQGGEELRVEIQLDANPVAITTFEMYGITSDVNPEQSIWLPRRDLWQETPGVGVMQVFKQRLTTQGDHTRREVARFVMNDTAAHITRLRIYAEGDPIHDMPTAVYNTTWQMDGKTPNANWQGWDGGQWSDGNRTIKSYDLNSLQVMIDTAAGVANPLTVYADSLGTAS